MGKEEKESRAAQFLPFNGLLGFYDLILEKRRPREPEQELSDDQLLRLDRIFKTLHKNDRVAVSFYDRGAYHKKEGILSDADLNRRTMTVGGRVISFTAVRSLRKMKK